MVLQGPDAFDDASGRRIRRSEKVGILGFLGTLVDINKCCLHGCSRRWPLFCATRTRRISAFERYVREIDVSRLPTQGPSRFELPAEGLRGTVSLSWLGHPYKGIACDLNSRGYKALCDAVRAVLGKVKPYSTTGGLPLVKDLQDAGFDVQITGFGREETYHAPNEFGVLSEFEAGSRIMTHILNAFDVE
jgi:acetylornithine deacetylase